MLTNNPNRSKSIEKAWDRELKRKMRALNTFMLNIPLTSITTNVSAEQQMQINTFMAAMREEAIGLLLADNWQSKYQTTAYERGIERADAELKAVLTAQEAAKIGTLDISATALVQTAVHQAELDFLHERANTKLSKWVDELLFDTRSILHEQLGIVSVDDIHEAITDRINVTTSRARVIEVTEIAQASQRAVVKEIEQVNSVSDEEVEVMWITVNDSHVRPLHSHWHRKVMSNEQASRNITISPWRCRCGLKPVIKNRISARQKVQHKKERDYLVSKVD